MTDFARRLAAPYVLSPSGELLRNGVITFDHDGRLISLEQQPQIDSLPRTEYHNGILIPGMVNAHCHLELSCFKEAVPEGTGLIDFITQIVSRRGDFPETSRVESAIRQDLYMWNNGIQAVGDISNGEDSFPAKSASAAQSRVMYHTFAEYFGMPTPDQADSKYAADTAHIASARALGLEITPSPHSIYLVSEALFAKAATSQRLSIHFLETPSEAGLFEARGRMYDYLVRCGMKPDFLAHGSDVQRLIDVLPPSMPLLLVHCTNMTEDQARRLMAYFTDITFVLCPRSNYYIERLYPPAVMLHRLGARVALGTDSLSSNHTLSMASEIGWLWKHNPDIDLGTILRWATFGGAAALGIDSEIGTFTPGKRPGAVLLDGIDLRSFEPMAELQAIRLL